MIAFLAIMLLMAPADPMPGRSFSGPLPPITAAQSAMAARLRADVTMLVTDIGDRNVFKPEALEKSAAFLERSLRDLGYTPVAQEYDCRGVNVRNICVEIAGTTRPKQVVLVGAHYDSVQGCPAANDNGSGVAGVLECARAFRDAKPARTIRLVFFVNEEPPFFQSDEMGSVVYANAAKSRGDDIVAMLSLETIGYYSDAPASQKLPPPFDRFFPSVGNYIAFVGNADSADLIRSVVGSFRARASFPSEGTAIPDALRVGGFSDQWSFWQAGYRGLMVTDTAMFRYPHYHEADDTPDKIDFERMARVVEGVIGVVRDLSSENFLPSGASK